MGINIFREKAKQADARSGESDRPQDECLLVYYDGGLASVRALTEAIKAAQSDTKIIAIAFMPDRDSLTATPKSRARCSAQISFITSFSSRRPVFSSSRRIRRSRTFRACRLCWRAIISCRTNFLFAAIVLRSRPALSRSERSPRCSS